MRKIVLISCVSKKLSHKAKVENLYISQLFKYSLEYAKSLSPDSIFVLSAKYGLLPLDKEIEPYNKTLKEMPEKEVKKWADGVIEQLEKQADIQNDEIIFFAEQKYRKYLVPHVRNYKIPLEGLDLFKQLKYLKMKLKNKL